MCNSEHCVVFIVEISKTIDMYMFLFDDILLLTKVKKPPRKVEQLNLYEQFACIFCSFLMQNNYDDESTDKPAFRCNLIASLLAVEH